MSETEEKEGIPCHVTIEEDAGMLSQRIEDEEPVDEESVATQKGGLNVPIH